jgi:hypothetical protein
MGSEKKVRNRCRVDGKARVDRVSAIEPGPWRDIFRKLAGCRWTWRDHSHRRAGLAPSTRREFACWCVDLWLTVVDCLVSWRIEHSGNALTAFSYIENKKAGVSLQGHSGQKTSFSGAAIHGGPNIRLLGICAHQYQSNSQVTLS